MCIALVLNVLEAYQLFEIAMLQDRLETDVQADIEDARNTLREQVFAGARSHRATPLTAVAAGSFGKI